jgi:hypothetical protein
MFLDFKLQLFSIFDSGRTTIVGAPLLASTSPHVAPVLVLRRSLSSTGIILSTATEYPRMSYGTAL